MKFLFLGMAAGVLLAGCQQDAGTAANNAAATTADRAAASSNVALNEMNGMANMDAMMMQMQGTPMPRDAAMTRMHERHEGMEDIGKNNKVLRRELTAASPDLGAVRAAAATIARHSSEAVNWFPAGTGPDVGKTGARPDIWQKPQDFAGKLRNFQVAAQALEAAAKGSDVAAIKARYATLGGTCKACHDSFRSEMHH